MSVMAFCMALACYFMDLSRYVFALRAFAIVTINFSLKTKKQQHKEGWRNIGLAVNVFIFILHLIIGAREAPLFLHFLPHNDTSRLALVLADVMFACYLLFMSNKTPHKQPEMKIIFPHR